MYKLIVAGAFAAILFASQVREADAQGVHFGAGGIHVDVGRPHGGYYGHRSSFYRGPSYRGYYSGGWGGYGGHDHWHNTSHYDYHSGGYRQHFDHYDYTPPHYDYHSQGHWDHHH